MSVSLFHFADLWHMSRIIWYIFGSWLHGLRWIYNAMVSTPLSEFWTLLCQRKCPKASEICMLFYICIFYLRYNSNMFNVMFQTQKLARKCSHLHKTWLSPRVNYSPRDYLRATIDRSWPQKPCEVSTLKPDQVSLLWHTRVKTVSVPTVFQYKNNTIY